MGLSVPMAAVYLSFTAEGQGSWERVSFPGIVGGGCVPGPRPGEMPAGGGGMFSQIFKRKRSTVGWVLDGWNARLTVPPVG